MKKTLLILLTVITATVMCFGLTGCYISKPGKMKDLVGIYELTYYSKTPKDTPSDQEAENRVETHNVKAYLVINSDGKGTYVYSDRDTAMTAYSVYITFTYDDEEPDKVDKIRYTNGLNVSNSGLPGSGRETLGLTFSMTKKTLNYTVPAIFGRDYSSSVTYTKVNKKTDLSFVAQKMGVNTIITTPFELNGMDARFYSYRYSYNDPTFDYIYYIVDVNSKTGKANVYYALKADGVDVQKTDLPITIDTSNPSETIYTINGISYKRYLNDVYSEYLTEIDSDGQYVDMLNADSLNSVAQIIETARAYYESFNEPND